MEINKYDDLLKNVADDINAIEATEQFLNDFYP